MVLPKGWGVNEKIEEAKGDRKVNRREAEGAGSSQSKTQTKVCGTRLKGRLKSSKRPAGKPAVLQPGTLFDSSNFDFAASYGI